MDVKSAGDGPGGDDAMTRGRHWRGVPRRVRITAGVGAAVLGYGGLVHVVQLVVGGWPPYPWAPAWLAAYFTSLTVLDPLAAVLLWRRRAAGLHLAILVLVTDAFANGYAVYGLSDHGVPNATGAARVSQAVVGLLAVCALAAAPRMRPWLRPPDSTRRCASANIDAKVERRCNGQPPATLDPETFTKGASDRGGGEHARNSRSG